MIDLYLVRHAEPVSDIDEFGQLVPESEAGGLSERGREQALRLAERMAQHIQPDALYSSPLSRALETARAVAEKTGLTIQLDSGLEELRINFPESATSQLVHAGWLLTRRAVNTPAFPGGESWTDLCRRASTAVETIVCGHPNQTVVVICHGGVIETIFFHFLGIPLERNLRAFIRIDHAAIFHWRWFLIEGMSGWELVTANDTQHLW